ncbi:unnamed protein product [Caenorhabditis sp. 36 PRJEB53466]|nr:unnamed protein product [Caenorhabditis sp. 36 PRJEB53466]
MDQNEKKTMYDVMAHLTDIPLLGKQYVPGLWRQFEGGSGQQHSRSGEPMNQSDVTTTSVQGNGKENTRAQVGGFIRAHEKRALPTPTKDVVADSDLLAPPAKTPRIEKQC